jgi:hypothetical protein
MLRQRRTIFPRHKVPENIEFRDATISFHDFNRATDATMGLIIEASNPKLLRTGKTVVLCRMTTDPVVR